jgi:large subunit ribosomal protein L29
MKFKELKDLSVKELELRLRENRASQLELRKKKGAGTLEKPHMLRLLRKDAARILTAVSAKKAFEKPQASTNKVAAKPVKAPKDENPTDKGTSPDKTGAKKATKSSKKESSK